MNVMRTVAALAAVIASVPLAARQHSASGTLTQDGVTVQLQSAVAIWDPDAKQLSVSLFPFTVSAEDVAALRHGKAVFVALDKPSPNPAHWPSPPFAELVIEFAGASVSLRPENVTWYALHVSWLGQMNHTLSVNRNSPETIRRELSSLAGSLRDGGSLTLTLSGEESFTSGARLSWSVRASSPVLYRR